MTNNSETEALRKYLTSEELWLRDVQREMGGRVYIETLGEKMVTALDVVFQGGDEATINRGLASFDMDFRMACEYALELKGEAVMLRSFLRGFGDSIADTGIQISEMPIDVSLEDDRTARYAGRSLAGNLRVGMVWMETKWAAKNLREQIANIESIEEVHLQKFVGGIKNELVRIGIM